MGLVTELASLYKKLKPLKIVHEWEQGLFIRKGRIIEVRIKPDPQTLEQIVEAERAEIQRCGGHKNFLLPSNSTPIIDATLFYPSFFFGYPRSKKREEKSKILKPGMYFRITGFEDVEVDSIQERILNLGCIVVPIPNQDEYNAILISCNVRYQLQDFYKAYTAVHDYQTSLKDHTLSILAKHSFGRSYEYWVNKRDETNKVKTTIQLLETDVEKDLRTIVTEKWGLKIHKVYITDAAPCYVTRQFHDTGSSVLPFRLD